MEESLPAKVSFALIVLSLAPAVIWWVCAMLVGWFVWVFSPGPFVMP
jgi:hypothetical protein